MRLNLMGVILGVGTFVVLGLLADACGNASFLNECRATCGTRGVVRADGNAAVCECGGSK